MTEEQVLSELAEAFARGELDYTKQARTIDSPYAGYTSTMYTLATIYDISNAFLRSMGPVTWADRERQEIRRRSLRGRMRSLRRWASEHRPYVHIGPCETEWDD